MATKHTPIRFAVPPGYFIREELEARGWSQETLAAKMGRPYQALNAIINGHKIITADTAIELGDAFGTSAIYWLNLQTAFQLFKAAQKKKLIATAKQTIGRNTTSSGKGRRKADPLTLDPPVTGRALERSNSGAAEDRGFDRWCLEPGKEENRSLMCAHEDNRRLRNVPHEKGSLPL